MFPFNSRGFLNLSRLISADIQDFFSNNDDAEFGDAHDGEDHEWLPNGEVA